jgi:hypothetical protein
MYHIVPKSATCKPIIIDKNCALHRFAFEADYLLKIEAHMDCKNIIKHVKYRCYDLDDIVLEN